MLIKQRQQRTTIKNQQKLDRYIKIIKTKKNKQQQTKTNNKTIKKIYKRYVYIFFRYNIWIMNLQCGQIFCKHQRYHVDIDISVYIII